MFTAVILRSWSLAVDVDIVATATMGLSQLTWCELWPQILVYTTNRRVSVAVAEH
jgi:hypothetical protein